MIKYKDLTPEQLQGAKKELRELVKYVVSEKLIPDLEEPEVKEEPTFPAYTERIEDSEIVKAYKRFKQSRTHKTAEERVYWLLEADHKMIELLANGEKEAALAYITEDKGRSMNTDIALISFDDYEREEPFTINLMDFYEMLIESVNKKDSDRAAYEMLGILVTSFKTFAETDGNIPDPDLKKEFIELLDKLSWILQQDAGGEILDRFLKGEQEFMVIPRPKGIDNFLKIHTVGNTGVQTREYEAGVKKVTFKGNLGIEEQKIHDMIGIAVINNNNYKARNNFDTLVDIPLTEIMRKLGRPINYNNKKQFARKLIKDILPSIHNTYIEYEMKDGKKKDYKIGRVTVGGGRMEANVKKDRVYFRVSPEYAYFLNAAPLSQFNSKALELGTKKKPQAYYMYRKMQEHYTMDANRSRSTHNILSVTALLDFCSEVIPSFEWVQENDQGHWIRRIRKPFEDALNEIKEKGIFEWSYCKKGMAEVTEKETRTTDYTKWSKLYITFRLIPDEPDQSQRLENKKQRIEAAQAKKDLREAETIIKADKIQRRKERADKKAGKTGGGE